MSKSSLCQNWSGGVLSVPHLLYIQIPPASRSIIIQSGAAQHNSYSISVYIFKFLDFCALALCSFDERLVDGFANNDDTMTEKKSQGVVAKLALVSIDT